MKEAYYFSHDANARHDPKITAMRGVYGPKGYAWYWILVEMMRECDSYKLDMQSKYAYHAFASQMQCETEEAHDFINDCINEFGLFVSADGLFWSESLLRRMEKREKRSEGAKKAAEARWANKPAPDKESSKTHMRKKCERIEDECQSDALKERKVKERKDIKNICVDLPAAESHVDDYHTDFERFWIVFPENRRRDKAKAFNIWKKKVKDSEREDLIRCTQMYARDFKTIGKDGNYAKMPTTYLNAGTYKDYLEGVAANAAGEHTAGSAGKYSDFIIE